MSYGRSLPAGVTLNGIPWVKQLVRAGDSIGANIAEGMGRGSFLDNRRFVRMARGSLNETKHWLRRAHKRSLLTPFQTEGLKPIVEELAPMLNAYLNSIGPLKAKAVTKNPVGEQGSY
jgi:four helix bundle protein